MSIINRVMAFLGYIGLHILVPWMLGDVLRRPLPGVYGTWHRDHVGILSGLVKSTERPQLNTTHGSG